QPWRYQMFPAPGVYDADTMLLVIAVSACTTPLNFDMPASTVTMPAETAIVPALIVSFADAVIVTPAASSLIELPLLSTISTDPGPSLNVAFWPPGVSSTSCSRPSESSSVTLTPLRDRI